MQDVEQPTPEDERPDPQAPPEVPLARTRSGGRVLDVADVVTRQAGDLLVAHHEDVVVPIDDHRGIVREVVHLSVGHEHPVAHACIVSGAAGGKRRRCGETVMSRWCHRWTPSRRRFSGIPEGVRRQHVGVRLAASLSEGAEAMDLTRMDAPW